MDLFFGDSWNPSLGRFRSPFAFRGHPALKADLSSGLLRLAAGRPDVERLELHLLRNFRKYAYGQAGGDSVWQWLALGQHRGLPTRLLDWTYSPLVAAHFATRGGRGERDGDRAVWRLDWQRVHELCSVTFSCARRDGSRRRRGERVHSLPAWAIYDSR